MWKGEEALSSVVYRVAVVGKNGIVPTAEVVAAWGTAENKRVWPPET